MQGAGTEPQTRVAALARQLAAGLAREPMPEAAPSVELSFGYARSPRDGADAALLLDLARRTRFRSG